MTVVSTKKSGACHGGLLVGPTGALKGKPRDGFQISLAPLPRLIPHATPDFFVHSRVRAHRASAVLSPAPYGGFSLRGAEGKHHAGGAKTLR